MNLKYIKKGKLCRKIIDLDILNHLQLEVEKPVPLPKMFTYHYMNTFTPSMSNCKNFQGDFFIIIFILSTHYLLYGYTEFSKSGFKTSSSCRLHNNHVMDTQGHG